MHAHWRIDSSFEVPLTVRAADWRTALCIGLQLLEREHVVRRLHLTHRRGVVTARDPETGEVFTLVQTRAWSAPVPLAA